MRIVVHGMSSSTAMQRLEPLESMIHKLGIFLITDCNQKPVIFQFQREREESSFHLYKHNRTHYGIHYLRS